MYDTPRSASIVPAAVLQLTAYVYGCGYVYMFTVAVPLPTLESLREIRNALRRVSDRVDLAIRDAEQQQVRYRPAVTSTNRALRCEHLFS